MKTKIILTIIFLLQLSVNAQTLKDKQHLQELPEVNFKDGVSLHFISPEPIQFVDLSTEKLTGDLPTKNIARVKLLDNSIVEDNILNTGDYLGVVTVVGQSFMAQYRLVYKDDNVTSNIQIKAEEMQPLEAEEMKLSSFELKKICRNIQKQKVTGKVRKVKDLRLKMELKNVYIIDDYIFIDLNVTNKTDLAYNVDSFKFSIEDKKIYKATNNQTLFIKPIYQYNKRKSFRYRYRNIFVFKKFTFPNSKILKIRLVENQISGRSIEMKIKYSDVLRADSF